ncbi:MAG: tetratricopeptide repeat protein [Magnetococcales bacterium]|nr:tetratricopeptide repeat protein [Magnetococcales bacterium]
MAHWRLLWLLALVPLGGCLLRSDPPRPPLAEKEEQSRDKARTLLQACKVRHSLQESQQTLYLAQLRDDRPAMANAFLELANRHLALEEYALAEERFLQAEIRFRRLNDEAGLLQTAFGQGMLLIQRGRHQAGRKILEAIRSNEITLRASLHNGLAMACRGEGLYLQALDHLTEAEKAARQTGSLPDLAATWMNRARVHFDQKKWSEAKEAASQALTLDREMENVTGTAADLVMLAAIAEKQELWQEAREQYQQAGDLFDYCGIVTQSEASHAKAKQLANHPNH